MTLSRSPRVNPNNAISRLVGCLVNNHLGSFLVEVDYEKIQTQFLAGQISLSKALIQQGATLHRLYTSFVCAFLVTKSC